MCECCATDDDSLLACVEGPSPDEDEFTPEDAEAVESRREDPLEGPSEDLLLPLLALFSDIFCQVSS